MLFHPETRRLRGNVVIPSVARAAEEMVLNAVEADASVVEADELVIFFFFSLNLEVFTCRSIAILSIKIGFDPFLLLITRDLRVLQLGVIHGQVELITAVAVGCALEVRDNGHGIHPQVPWDQWTYAEVVPVLCEGKRFRCQKLIET